MKKWVALSFLIALISLSAVSVYAAVCTDTDEISEEKDVKLNEETTILDLSIEPYKIENIGVEKRVFLNIDGDVQKSGSVINYNIVGTPGDYTLRDKVYTITIISSNGEDAAKVRVSSSLQPYVKGKTSGAPLNDVIYNNVTNSQEKADSCINSQTSNTLNEYYCASYGAFLLTKYECQYGCENGACRRSAKTTETPSISTTPSEEKSQAEAEIETEAKIEYNGKSVNSQAELVKESSKTYVKTSSGNKEVKILPAQAILRSLKVENVEDIQIEEFGGEAVYKISGNSKGKLFFIFPATLKVEQRVNVETGDVESTDGPWWSFLASYGREKEEIAEETTAEESAQEKPEETAPAQTTEEPKEDKSWRSASGLTTEECGEVVNADVKEASIPSNAALTGSLSCSSNSITDCYPSKIKFTFTSGRYGILHVRGYNNLNCLARYTSYSTIGKIVNTDGIVECAFSKELLDVADADIKSPSQKEMISSIVQKAMDASLSQANQNNETVVEFKNFKTGVLESIKCEIISE